MPVSLPVGAVVGIWMSFNGRTLSLSSPAEGHCTDGVPGSPFGTFAYCNASAFFAAVTADHSVRVPALGTGKDGLPCPTSRDFSVVDQDQSDTVATGYRIVNGRMAQDTTATRGGTPLTSGPDHRLLAEKIDRVLGCTPFLAPDLTDGSRPTAALALDELLAGAHQRSRVPTATGGTTTPGGDVVDLIAWDSYAWGPNSTPEHVFGAAQAATASVGKPWAVAETGVSAVTVKDPNQRNQRLTAMSHYLATQNPKPEFVSYFDSEPDSSWKWNISRNPSAAAAWKAGE